MSLLIVLPPLFPSREKKQGEKYEWEEEAAGAAAACAFSSSSKSHACNAQKERGKLAFFLPFTPTMFYSWGDYRPLFFSFGLPTGPRLGICSENQSLLHKIGPLLNLCYWYSQLARLAEWMDV